MTALIGMVVVILSIIVGYTSHHGNLWVLYQPSEFLIIGGAGFGSLLVMCPPPVLRGIMKALPTVFQNSKFTKEVSLELIALLYEIFSKVKRDGALAIETDVEDPSASEMFGRYPGVLAFPAAISLLCDTLRLMLMGVSIKPYDLDDLMTMEIDTHEEEAHNVTGALATVADAFPALGIVAAVLGVIITMGKMNESPEVIGMGVAAALVGTFLGVLMCYGIVGPVAKALELKAMSEHKMLEAIKASMLAFAKDVPPRIAVEFGRRTLYHETKPAFSEVEETFRKK